MRRHVTPDQSPALRWIRPRRPESAEGRDLCGALRPEQVGLVGVAVRTSLCGASPELYG
jgi:hypothetical protein